MRLVAGEAGRLDKTGRLDIDETVCLDALVGLDSGEPVVNALGFGCSRL